jgi:hypothetical protein
MEHQMIVRLTDDEYTALTAQAKQTGKEIEALIHELLDEILKMRTRSSQKSNHTLSREELEEYLYEEGVIDYIPTHRVYSKEEEEERQRLADLFGQAGGKSASEMVIEDRGPY